MLGSSTSLSRHAELYMPLQGMATELHAALVLRSLTRSVSLGNALPVPGAIAPRGKSHRPIVAPAYVLRDLSEAGLTGARKSDCRHRCFRN